ncbi:hypothetical protein MC885_016343 [Smutsia gigantea]|nr:hypothetical protein MC885_016343 [Smutsia gigantea]
MDEPFQEENAQWVNSKESRGADGSELLSFGGAPKKITQQQDFWAGAGPQQVRRAHAGRQSRDTQEAGGQQLGWQGEVGAQQVGLHNGLQMRDTQEEGLQQDRGQGVAWQHRGAGQGAAPEQTGTQHMGLQHTGSQQACWHREEVQQMGWQLDSWQQEGVHKLVQADWQGLHLQLTGVHTRVGQGAGAQQLGAQQGGSQQLSGQSSLCQEGLVQEPQDLGRQTRQP